MLQIELSSQPIDSSTDLSIFSGGQGAVNIFWGVVRKDGNFLHALQYTAYDAMAHKELEKIGRRLIEKFDLSLFQLWHRLGVVEVAQPSLKLIVAAQHRKEALAATIECIDLLKQSVPIWKKEIYTDGSSRWCSAINA